MIYTIGKTKAYTTYFATQAKPEKLGRRLPCPDPNFPDGYVGGAVWKTREDALGFITARGMLPLYSVYGVVAEWGIETIPTDTGEPWHNLLVDAELVQLAYAQIP